MATINRVLISNDNILIIDSSNKLWIMGGNEHRRTGVGENLRRHAIHTPEYTGIQLDGDENIKKFHVYDSLITIFTTHGRLFIGNHQYMPDSISEYFGETFENFFYGSRQRTNTNSLFQLDASFVTEFPPNRTITNMLDKVDTEIDNMIDNMLESKTDTNSNDSDNMHGNSDSDDGSSESDNSDSGSDNEHIIAQDDVADNLCTFRRAIRMRNKFNIEKIAPGFSLLESSIDQIM